MAKKIIKKGILFLIFRHETRVSEGCYAISICLSSSFLALLFNGALLPVSEDGVTGSQFATHLCFRSSL